jgi:opacity protein-like surface antigen
MKRAGIIAVLAGVSLALSASVALAVTQGTYTPTSGSFNGANAPGSSHLSSGTVQCVVDSSLNISCSPYVLGGVGHTNADVRLAANYTAIVDCYNGGTNPNNPVESHTTSFSPSSDLTVTSSKNGQLSVPAQSTGFGGAPVGCPNSNWTPRVRSGSVTLLSFTYTLTFAGFSSPYITITASDP